MLIIFVSDKTVLTAKMSDSTELPETASPTGSSETKSSKKNDQPEFELAASSIPASEYRRYFFSDLQTKPNGKRKYILFMMSGSTGVSGSGVGK